MPTKQKLSGAYFTPSDVASTLVDGAVREKADRSLDPSCGDGRFIARHGNSVGVESDERSATASRANALSASVISSEFLSWEACTNERFECAAGNPSFIPYQTFTGTVRSQALLLCRAFGADFNGLTSSWVSFLVVTAGLLKPGDEWRLLFLPRSAMRPMPHHYWRFADGLLSIEALSRFATYSDTTQSQMHIKPLHWYVACRLVVEGGFDPQYITPRPPFVVKREGNKAKLIYNPSVAPGGEAVILGGLKTKDVDVVVSLPGIGPVPAVSSKGMTGAFRNLTNRMEETIGECTNLHITYPALVFGYLFVI